ncbi:MAG TPA: peptidoglycan-binding protein [Candidatus Dormibacteraeota bacterium]|nr:peptidoglycan-binding protein [Candidatus Dormibacteraeota bacterium]
MGTVEGMLAQARALLGLGEDPPGSNHNKVTAWYGFDGAWCDMAISYEAGHSDNLAACMGKFAYTVAHAEAFRAHGRWHYGLGGIRPGDVVFFDWSGTRVIGNIDHVGLVEAVHSDGTITTLEGNTSNMFLRRRRNGSVVVGYGRPAYGDAAPMPSSDGVLREGSTGPAVATLQRNLNTVMGSGLAVDGDFGALTKAALEAFQRRFGIGVDGEYGPQSAAMMKAALAGRTQPVKPTPKPPPAGTLAVDGQFGPATCAAMQRALNAHGAGLVVDGAFGPLTKKALQRYLGVTADGVIGPATTKALQKHVGATQDGVWGPDTTRHLQTALNAGRF